MLALLFWSLAIAGIVLWATSAKAESVFDNSGYAHNASYNAVVHNCTGAQQRAQLGFTFTTTSQVVISSARIMLNPGATAVTSSNATLSVTIAAGTSQGIPNYPFIDLATSTDTYLTFNFIPAINLYAGNTAEFMIGDPFGMINCVGGTGNQVYALATRVHATGTITNITEFRNGYAADLELCPTELNCWDPILSINGQAVDDEHPPDPGTFGLSGTSTNPGDFGLFGSWFMAALQWLFVPSDQAETDLNDAKADLATRIPFGWFAQVSSTFAGLDTDSTTSSIFVIVASSTTSTLTATFFDPTQIEGVIPENILTLIRFLGGLVLWTGLFVWIVSLVTDRAPSEESTL